MGSMKSKPLVAYLVLVAALSIGFVAAMRLLGERGQYLAGPYMLTPALAALITRLFFYRRRFDDARLGFGRWRDYFRFWAITLAVVALSYAFYTVFGAVSWDLSGETFLTQLDRQMEMSGGSMAELPDGMTPLMMLWLFFIGGLTLFNIPMTLAGFGEEFGWRGLMLPLLCRDRDDKGSEDREVGISPATVLEPRLAKAFVIGGLIWFAWHTPLMLVMPSPKGFTVAHHIVNALILAFGSVFTFVFFAWTLARSGSIWVASFVHAVFNNGARSFSYFVTVENQIDANAALAATMLLVVAVLFRSGEFRHFRRFLESPGGS